MQTNKLKTYAPKARRDFIAAVTRRAALFGLTASGIAEAREQGELVIIDGQPHPRRIGRQRAKLVERIRAQGFEQVMEAAAYTWFNRLIAIRYMELHGFLDHSYRVLSPAPGLDHTGAGDGAMPEILDQAQHVELPGLDRERVIALKMDGTQDETLYRELLLAQCRALHQAMPFLFEPVNDETELLLPDRLLQTDSLIRELVSAIPEDDWQPIEIIGWLYQFYISEKKDQVIGKVVKSEDIPAATQLFTPNWIVKYMVQNSLGAQWLATYPDSPLKGQMEYYIEPAEQTPEVQAQLEKMQREWLREKARGAEGLGVRDEGLGKSGDGSDSALAPHLYSLSPEHLTLIDPACGSGHILVEAYELFKAIYLERGYRLRDIPKLILEKNLYGLDIDPRAAQLAGFALMMKAREDDRRVLERGVALNVMAFEEVVSDECLVVSEEVKKLGGEERIAEAVEQLVELFRHARTFGSLIQVPEGLAAKLLALKRLTGASSQDLFVSDSLKRLGPMVRQAEMLAAQYDAVVANPPYMGSGGMNPLVTSFAKEHFPKCKLDLYAISTLRFLKFAKPAGMIGLMTPFTWMSLSTYEGLRSFVLDSTTLRSLIQPEYHAFFDSAFVPVCSFVLQNTRLSDYEASFISLSDFYGASVQAEKAIEGVHNPAAGWHYRIKPDLFKQIPGCPLAYRASAKLLNGFKNPRIGSLTKGEGKNITADNDRFLRFWWEIANRKIGKNRKWLVYAKGGNFRKWAGNLEYVCNWSPEAREFYKKNASSRIIDSKYWYLEGITWTVISPSTIGFRLLPVDTTFDTKGLSLFFNDNNDQDRSLLLCNSIVGQTYLRTLNTTFSVNTVDVKAIPYVAAANVDKSSLQSLTGITQEDWDAYERSSGFQSPPIVTAAYDAACDLECSFEFRVTQNRNTITEIKRLEEENNRLFIDAYGLQDELTPEVPIEQITLTVNPAYRYGWKGVRDEGRGASEEGARNEGGRVTEDGAPALPNPSPLAPNPSNPSNPSPLNPDPYQIPELAKRFREDTMQELVSYAIGCAMGRYRLDRPGLIYAHSGNEDFWPIYEGSNGNGKLTPAPLPLTPSHRGVSEELPRSHRLAEIDGTGGASLPDDQDLSCGGALRSQQSNSASGSIDTLEHRGGACQAEHGGVSELPFDRSGLASRGGDADADRHPARLRDEFAGRNDPIPTDRAIQDAQHAAKQTRPSSLTPNPFLPDEDGIIPITDTDWFDDDATHRVVEFISVAWDKGHLEENLRFLADNLSPKRGEAPRDTIRRYLADKFFKDHLQTYKKRPIYWCFSSGKQKAFQCLVYLHRYNEGTLARMRMEYVVPLQSKMAARIDSLADDIEAASSGAQAKRLQKERDKLGKQLDELRHFDEQLRHYADQRIALDLDDGVKVNYGKFGNLLAEVKAVTGR